MSNHPRPTTNKTLFDKVDCLNVKVGDWAKDRGDEGCIWCILCNKQVPIDHSGMSQVNQHVIGKKHSILSEQRFSKTQPKFLNAASNVILGKPLDVRVVEAEILYAFKVAEQDWSFRSCDGTGTLFENMHFGEVASKFGLGHSKMSYVCRHALGPAVLEEYVADISNSDGCYTLLLDETANAQVKKQCDFLVRYWSPTEEEVSTKYITSRMFGHTSADHLEGLVFDVLESSGIQCNRFANLSTDGPNINIGLHSGLDSALQEKLCVGLLPFNPCCLHKCHNAYHKGIVVYGCDVENLAFDLHSWFKIAPCKREDFMMVAAELQDREIFQVFSRNEALFYRHIATRWLTLVPSLLKIEQRWDQSKEYFLTYLPTCKKFETSTAINKRYIRIKDNFAKEKFLLVQMAFVIDVSTPFTAFLTLFQSQQPLIHIVFKEMKCLLLTVMRRFLHSNVVSKKSGKELLQIDVRKRENQLSVEDIVVGAKTERLLKKLSPYDEKRERGNMLSFFIAVTTYLQKKLPLKDALLISAQCLNPDNRINESTVRNINYLTKKFPHVVTEREVSIVTDEWKLYQVEPMENLPYHKGMRIDHYWRNVFNLKSTSGGVKYPLLSKIVKSVLSLHHGNSAVERSLSDNKNTVRKDRTDLIDDTITALRRMKEYARSKGGAENIVVTSRMVDLMREAKKKDDERIVNERKKRELSDQQLREKEKEDNEKEQVLKKCSKSKVCLEDAELSYEKKEGEIDNDLKLALKVIESASASLNSSLASNDMYGLQVAQELLESSKKKVECLSQDRAEQAKQREKIGVKRKKTIETLFSTVKKPKMKEERNNEKEEPAVQKPKPGCSKVRKDQKTEKHGKKGPALKKLKKLKMASSDQDTKNKQLTISFFGKRDQMKNKQDNDIAQIAVENSSNTKEKANKKHQDKKKITKDAGREFRKNNVINNMASNEESEGDEKFTVVRRYAVDDRSSDEEKAETQPKLKKAKGKKISSFLSKEENAVILSKDYPVTPEGKIYDELRDLYLLWPLKVEELFNSYLEDLLTLLRSDTPCLQEIRQHAPSMQWMPTEYKDEGFVALEATGNGNCLFNVISIFLCGNESQSAFLRMMTSLELHVHADYYVTHPALVHARKKIPDVLHLEDFLVGGEGAKELENTRDFLAAVQVEAKENTRLYRYAAMICVMGLASVIQRSIFSVYPDSTHKFFPLLNQKIDPRCDAMYEPIHVQWTTMHEKKKGYMFNPNHFVPLIRF